VVDHGCQAALGQGNDVGLADVQAGGLAEHLRASARAQRLRRNRLAQLGGPAGQVLGGGPGPVRIPVRGADQPGVLGPAPVTEGEPQQLCACRKSHPCSSSRM
jgi:hypothetical protein